jgi:2',3'-cyclic-nucleotide 2'-phosphodiesterase (5'-nucleotidase family)
VFTILHTNDFHNRLLPEQAARLTGLRRSIGNTGLLLDAGDAISAGNITFRPGGEPILTEMTSIGYDVMTVGNREFHFSRQGFFAKLGCAGFPVLSANVRPMRGGASLPAVLQAMPVAPQAIPLLQALNSNTNSCDIDPEQGPSTGEPAARAAEPAARAAEPAARAAEPAARPVQSFVLFELAGKFRVLAFGLTVPMITERMASRHVSAFVFDDPIAVGTLLTSRLKAAFQPDLLIALTHIGIARDRDLAVAAPEIDLIIGGHTHVVLEHGERIGETLIVQAGSHGRYYGIVEVAPNSVEGGRPELTARLEPLC